MSEKRCINCGLSLLRIKSETVACLALDKKELLKQWIPKIEILDTHPICRECITQLEMSEEGATRAVGHPKICLNCGCSTLRNIRVVNPKHNLFEYLMGLARENLPDSLKGVTSSSMCMKCSRRLQYKKPTVNTEVCLLPADQSDLATETVQSDELKTSEESTDRVVQTIQLSEYKRVKASDDKCVVGKDCEGELKPVPLLLRQSNLVRRALYVPHGIKLCAKHSQLPPPSNVSIDHSFSGEEIADMLFLLQCVPPLEANGVIDTHICRERFGVEYSEFKETLRKCGSRLQEAAGSAREARLAVAAYFLTRHRRRHDCHTVLASLLQCHPTQVHTLAKLAEDCLENPQNGTESRTDDVSKDNDDEISALEMKEDPITV